MCKQVCCDKGMIGCILPPIMRGVQRFLLKKVHPIYFVGMLLAAILIGVIAAKFVYSTWLLNPLWWVIFLTVGLFCFIKRSRWVLVLIVLVGLGVGYAQGTAELESERRVVPYMNQQVHVEGTVIDDIEQGKRGDYIVRLGDVTVQGEKAGGTLWVTSTSEKVTTAKRSDKVEVSGKLTEGFGTFTGSLYQVTILSMRHEEHKDLALEVRDWFSGAVRSVLPETQAALGAGFLLGQRRSLPVSFEEALQIVGLTHVVVASGYNLTILVRIARRLFAKVSRYLALVSAGGLMLGFIAITGASPSMTRAGIVAGLSLLVWYYGRTIHPVVLLLIGATGSVVINPSFAWGDIGWLLSFTSFAGVMFLAPLLTAYFYGNEKPPLIPQIITETFSAQIMTMPIIVLVFGTFSNIALLANVLILPLVPLAMLLVAIAGVGAVFLPAIAAIIAWPALIVLNYMTWMIEQLANFAWASQKMQLGVEWVILWYIALIGIIVLLKYKTRFNFRKVNIVE